MIGDLEEVQLRGPRGESWRFCLTQEQAYMVEAFVVGRIDNAITSIIGRASVIRDPAKALDFVLRSLEPMTHKTVAAAARERSINMLRLSDGSEFGQPEKPPRKEIE